MRELILSIPFAPTELLGKEAELKALTEEKFKALGYKLTQVILGHLNVDEPTPKGPFMHTLSSPSFPACTTEQLDAKKGTWIVLIDYKFGSTDRTLSGRIELNNIKPTTLRTYFQRSIRSNAAKSTWENLLKHRPNLREIYSPKQAGALLATRLRIFFSKNKKELNWQEDASVKFCLLKPVDAKALIKGLFKPKFDYTTGQVNPPDMKAISRGLAILGQIKSQMNWDEPDLQAYVLETLGKNVNWWTEQGLSFHHIANMLTQAQTTMNDQSNKDTHV